MRAGFDVGMSQEVEFDHTIVVPLHFLVPGGAVPIVPVYVNGLIAPLPPAHRCHALDRLVAEATEERLAEAGNAGGELLEWIAMLGTIAPARPAFLEAQREFGHAYAAWPGA